MKKTIIFPLVILMAILMVSCQEAPQDPVLKIESLENELFSDDAVFNEEGRKKAGELVDLYTAYAEQHPQDPATPEYLFKAADITMNLFDPSKAINLYNKIIYKYPDYQKAPECLFLVAYIYENYLQNYGKAEEVYRMFIEKYPDNEFADDAELSIKNMGKTPEELIREFEESNP